MENNKLTLKDIAAKANCPPYVVRYLHTCRRLPIIKESSGAGYPVEFDEKSVDIVRQHLNKNPQNQTS